MIKVTLQSVTVGVPQGDASVPPNTMMDFGVNFRGKRPASSTSGSCVGGWSAVSALCPVPSRPRLRPWGCSLSHPQPQPQPRPASPSATCRPAHRPRSLGSAPEGAPSPQGSPRCLVHGGWAKCLLNEVATRVRQSRPSSSDRPSGHLSASPVHELPSRAVIHSWGHRGP